MSDSKENAHNCPDTVQPYNLFDNTGNGLGFIKNHTIINKFLPTQFNAYKAHCKYNEREIII